MLENAQNEENCDPPPTTFWVSLIFLQINPSPFPVIAYSFYERNGFNGSSQRLLFKVSLSVFTILQHILDIPLAEWRGGQRQCVLLLRRGGRGGGEGGAEGERGRGRLPGVSQTYQSDWDGFQETSQVFLQSQEGRREKVRLVGWLSPSVRLTGVACRISGVLFDAQTQVVSQAEQPSQISVIENQDETDKPSEPE